MLILSQHDIKQSFTMREAIAASKHALALYSNNRFVVPLRTSISIPAQSGQCLFMPAYSEEQNIVGIKIVSVFPNNVKRGLSSVLAHMLLLNGATGETLAMIDGTYLTQLRTGALQGAATDILARKDAKIAALFGTGGQAATHLEALLVTRELSEVRIVGRDFTRTQQFVSRMQEQFPTLTTRLLAVQNAHTAIQDADIITAVTTSNTPVFDGSLVKPGAHINGMGSYTPTMQELPESIIRAANNIIVDTRDGALAEAGDLIIPLKAGLITPDAISGELGDVILGKLKGRETETDITVFKSVGSAVLDLVTSFEIYKTAIKQNAGVTVA